MLQISLLRSVVVSVINVLFDYCFGKNQICFIIMLLQVCKGKLSPLMTKQLRPRLVLHLPVSCPLLLQKLSWRPAWATAVAAEEAQTP